MNRIELEKDLRDVCKKHKFHYVAIVATTHIGLYYGFSIELDEKERSPNLFFASLLNADQLLKIGRKKADQILNTVKTN